MLKLIQQIETEGIDLLHFITIQKIIFIIYVTFLLTLTYN